MPIQQPQPAIGVAITGNPPQWQPNTPYTPTSVVSVGTSIYISASLVPFTSAATIGADLPNWSLQ